MTEKTPRGKVRMTWTDGNDREVVRDVKQTINVQDFIGKPGYAWLVMAANPHLSAPDIERLIALAGVPHCERSANWIRRRRWLFHPSTTDQPGRRPDADGEERRATLLMFENPKMSLRDLVVLLKERGIRRGREWVRLHRCDHPY